MEPTVPRYIDGKHNPAYGRAYYLANIEKAKAQSREREKTRVYSPEQQEQRRASFRVWQQRNKEKVKADRKAYGIAHRDELRQRARERRMADPERYRAKNREWHANNREKVIAQARAWRAKHPTRWKHYALKASYGMSVDAYNQMVLDRVGLCDICKEKPTGKKGADVLHIDHDHKTGAVRGLLCTRCNRGLGMFKDSVASLDAAIAYLKSHAQPKSSEA